MFLAIDIGATYTKYGYYKKDGECIKKDKFPTIKTNKEDFYNGIKQLIKQDIEAIGISMPGLIDSNQGYIEAITLLPFLKETYLVKELQESIHIPIYIENDAKCAALGEMWKGSLKDIQNGLFIILGSGIGGTIILNGKIYKSKHNKAGEIGSILMPTTNNDNYTNFGRHNNANALIKKLSEVMNTKEDGYQIFKDLPKHQEALKALYSYSREIAFMIYNLDYILDLDVVCIGGGLSEQPLLIEAIQQEFKKLREMYKEDLHEPYITHCKHYNDANLLGALSLTK